MSEPPPIPPSPAQPPPLPPPVFQPAAPPAASIAGTIPEAIKRRFLEYLEQHHDLYCAWWPNLVYLAMGLTLIFLPRAIKGWLLRRRVARKLGPAVPVVQMFARNSQVVMGFPVIVNTMLLEPQDEPSAGLVLICFDPSPSATQLLASLVERIADDDGPQFDGADRDLAQSLLDDEEHQLFRRRRLPDSMTGGRAVYACDLMITPGFLVGKHVSAEMPLIPCLAEPGDKGRILHLPYWVISEESATTSEQDVEFCLWMHAFHLWSEGRTDT